MRCCILVIATLVLSGCPSSGVPAADRCSPGSANGVDSLEIGPGGDQGSDDTTGFFAYHDGSHGDYAIGGQGLTMLRVRIRVKGAGAPACLAQQTDVSSGAPGTGFVPIGSDRVPRTTYLQPDGSRVTRAMYIVLDQSPGFGEPSTQVTTAVGGRTISLVLDDNGEGRDSGIPELGDLGTHD